MCHCPAESRLMLGHEQPLHTHILSPASEETKAVLCCSWNKLLVSSGQRRTGLRLSLVSPKVFFLNSVTDGVLFLAAVASGLLSCGHLISSDIVDLIAQILLELN